MNDERLDRALSIFFYKVFGKVNGGFICIAALPVGKRDLRERFFQWPSQLPDMISYIHSIRDDHNVYFCPQTFEDLNFRRQNDGKGPRVKENIKECPVVWSDLDSCSPSALLVRPSIILETSYQRFQALWILEDADDGLIAEAISKRIAYAHAHEGADRSGWDLTQLLRVPGTVNHKYEARIPVQITSISDAVYRATDFEIYPQVVIEQKLQLPLPEPLEESAEQIVTRLGNRIGAQARQLFYVAPRPGEFSEGWSGALWKLIMLLFEAELSREEVFHICKQAACNKYVRDNLSQEELWKDIVRGYVQYQENIKTTIIPEMATVELLTASEVEIVKKRRTFVERYIEWASGLGDAAVQYHQAGAFIILSALLAGKVVLPTSFGNIVPNLWFMILADTTITRKSTAMDIATDLLIEVDSDVIMATDGSIEGLLTGLSMRPGRPSIFLRDEFSGLLEAMTKKDYMAGMAETLTKLYDGKYSKRILRKESIEIKDPVLILFAGGIRNRIQQLLTLDHVSSGFMPRFVYITAESDISRVKPIGPPIVRDMSGREALLKEMQDIGIHYNQLQPVDGFRVGAPPRINAELTTPAWLRFNKFEADMLKAGHSSDKPEILSPVYDRLGKSVLKAAVLLAASEQRTHDVVVHEEHILHALFYASGWREYAIEVINGVGKSTYERDIERILEAVKRRPGISRSTLMQSYHLTASSANQLFDTMIQRNLIRVTKSGNKAQCYWPVTKGQRHADDESELEPEDGYKVSVSAK